MAKVPSQRGLTVLAEEVGRIAPVALFGFVQGLSDERASIFYACSDGMAQCTVPASDVPDTLVPTGEEPREAGPTVIDAKSDGVVEGLLRFAGARRVVSIGIAHRVPTRFWMASLSPEAFTTAQTSSLCAVAASGARLLDLPAPPDEAMNRLTRLDQAGELLPELLRVTRRAGSV